MKKIVEEKIAKKRQFVHTLIVGQAQWRYPIHVGTGLLSDLTVLAPHIRSQRIAIISAKSVAALYLKQLKQTLSNYQITQIILPDGEQVKSLKYLADIMDVLVANRHDRQTTLIALGGGVIGDITGFAAACYMRGVDYIQIPTTLLAQVDSSVGGKTAVNHPGGKNMIGAFYQPKCVLADLDTLKTLPKRELAAGMAEVIKYGLIADADFYRWINQYSAQIGQYHPEYLAKVVTTSCAIKGKVVTEDEKESGFRAVLNFGHTFAHAIEAFQRYRHWLHGEAVAAGMQLALALSRRMGGDISEQDLLALRSLLGAWGLPIRPPSSMSLQDYLFFMSSDKKVLNNKIRFTLLHKIGKAYISDQVTDRHMIETLTEVIDKY